MSQTAKWIYCRICNNKTRNNIREDTILEAVKNRDYQTAYSAMREHISYVNLTVKYG